MLVHRRKFAALAAAGFTAAMLLACVPVAAQGYAGTVRILVAVSGGATDVVARQIADKLKDTLGQTLIIDNRPGAGGQIAAQALKAAPADGSTVMLSIDHTQVIIPLTLTTAGYDAVKDFTPLAGVAFYYNALAVSSSLNVKTMAELAAGVKANPTLANYGVPAYGSVPQFAGHIIGKSFGVTMNSVPYKGGAPLINDLLAGQIPVGIASLTELIDHHRAGRMRVLATSGTERSTTAPEIPTFHELGLKGIDKNPWLAFFGPKGLPPEFVARFNKAVQTALAQPDLRERLAKIGNEVAPASAAEVQQWVAGRKPALGRRDSRIGLQAAMSCVRQLRAPVHHQRLAVGRDGRLFARRGRWRLGLRLGHGGPGLGPPGLK